MSTGPHEGAPCPLCGSGPTSSGKGTLTLKQINFSEAIYVCGNEKCHYPVGEDPEPLIVKRDISELLPDGMAPSDATLQQTGNSCSPVCQATEPVTNLFAGERKSLSTGEEAKESRDQQAVEFEHPESWYDSLLDADVCDWLDSQA